MAFHVGQKVVCVDASPSSYYGPTPLKVDAVYTVLRVIFAPDDPIPGLFVAEVKASAPFGFKSERFRPAVERGTETGMAILRKAADDAGKRKQLSDALR